MTGIRLNEILSAIHFWSFFIGVNLTFFPMHYLGFMGMPRRVGDYPEIFALWNKCATFGSNISLISFILFLFIVIHAFYMKSLNKMPQKIELKTSYILQSRNTSNSFFPFILIVKYFPSGATDVFDHIINLHNDIMTVSIFITIFIFWILLTTIITYSEMNVDKTFGYSSKIKKQKILEVLWTLIPALILVWIAIPSITLLYFANTPQKHPSLTVHITGNQWYWHYKYSVLKQYLITDPVNHYSITFAENLQTIYETNKISFDSYMKPLSDLEHGDRRLFETDKSLFLPNDCVVKVLVTSSDVIHSWTVPQFGIKIDAIPGRLNQGFIQFEDFTTGTFFGQCSELCGVNHAFMPISVTVVDYEYFFTRIVHNLYKETISAEKYSQISSKNYKVWISHLWEPKRFFYLAPFEWGYTAADDVFFEVDIYEDYLNFLRSLQFDERIR